MNIIALNHKDKAAIKSVSYLHKTLLPTSPIARLGSTFMEKFYYSKLIKDGLIHCDYYQHAGKIVGFIAYTKRPFNLFKLGLRKNFFYLSGLMIFLFLQKPHKIIRTLGVFRLNKGIRTEDNHEGAILSFGVLPEYRNRHFIHKTGILISHQLFQSTVESYRNENISRLRMLVEPDNTEALLFYHRYGCQYQKIDLVGKAMIRVTFRMH